MTTFVVIESITPNQSLVFSAQQGPQGATGATGTTGATGATGATGSQGNPGTAATIAAGTTTTGAAGSSAAVANSGTTSAAVFDFTIPRGATGSTGSAATIAVGTTTTGAAGTSATVTNSGTSAAATFNFTIPQGQPGTPGATSTAIPLALGTAAAGTGTLGSKDDHVHPTTGVGLTANPLSQFAATTSAQLLGVISDETGTGALVFANTPTLVTPVLGVATGTSFNSITGLSSTTPVVDGTAAVGTETTTARGNHVHPTDTSRAATSGTLAQFAATTSAQLAGVVSDETGTGSLVFATSPTLVTPNLGTPSAINLTNATAVPSDATKANIASPTFTGTVTIPTGAVITAPKIGCTYSAKTAAYTFASGDEGNLFSMNNAATQQFNIPTDATFNFAIGTEFTVFWITGAGQPTIGATTPGTTTVISTGATSATPKLRVANSGATCKKIAANSWIIFGDLA